MLDAASEEIREAIEVIGETLAPLFLYEPIDERARAIQEAFAASDAHSIAEEWPFVATETAQPWVNALSEQGIFDDDDVLWDYRLLFVGPGRKKTPPWGSVYTDRECVVFGEATLELRQWMRENGISRPGDGTEPEDHIGLMLLLMAWIARERPELLDEYLRCHLLTWAPHFLEEMEGESDIPFYQALAALTRASLLGIQGELELAVELPKFYR